MISIKMTFRTIDSLSIRSDLWWEIPSLRTLYNWFNTKVLSPLKQALIFKKTYHKKSKKVKEPKRPKAVFNAHWKTHEDYLKIVDQPNIYQLDPITGKKKKIFID